jgi:hypothetical protein
MEYIISKLKKLWSKEDLEGYFLMTDNKTNKSLVLVKNSENTWKTEWLDKSVPVNKPTEQLNSIFINQ